MMLATAKPACTCALDIDADLSKRDLNTLVVTDLLSGAVIIATDKVDPKRRGRPVAAIASFCPFCGVKYRKPEKRQVADG